jgi:3-phenylpropionate/trans-cinnamate dioxygenase ferredoxin reductase subunit
LESVLGRKLGEWFAELHRAEGVRLLTHRTVAGVVANGRITALKLSDGTAVEADEVLVGIGVRPDTEWLAGTPLDSEGVHVDEHGRTAVPDVFAAGDVASTYHPAAGRHIPGSHWEAADRQATRAARAMLDLDPGKVELASFWSDQYGIRIQYLGHAPLADKVTINGDPTQRNFTATYTREGQIVGALLVDRPRSLPAIRNQITQGAKTPMTYITEIDEDACAAHGDCVAIAPEIFALEDVATVIGTGPDDLTLAAAEACPSAAIRVIDQAGCQVFP